MTSSISAGCKALGIKTSLAAVGVPNDKSWRRCTGHNGSYKLRVTGYTRKRAGRK